MIRKEISTMASLSDFIQAMTKTVYGICQKWTNKMRGTEENHSTKRTKLRLADIIAINNFSMTCNMIRTYFKKAKIILFKISSFEKCTFFFHIKPTMPSWKTMLDLFRIKSPESPHLVFYHTFLIFTNTKIYGYFALKWHEYIKVYGTKQSEENKPSTT